LKEIKGDAGAEDEIATLNDWLKLKDQESGLKKCLQEAEATLDGQAYALYPKLTESEIKTLVVDDKWLSFLDVAISGEMGRVGQQLAQGVKELAERYELRCHVCFAVQPSWRPRLSTASKRWGSYGCEA
jgi:type I restriction enzyme M protein